MKAMLVAIFGALLTAGAALGAPPAPATCQVPAAGNTPMLLADPLLLCHLTRSKLETTAQSLRAQIAALQARIDANAGLTFTCTDRQTSRNSQGLTEDCAPYVCDTGSGRCRSDARTSADCTSGFNMRDGRCVRH